MNFPRTYEDRLLERHWQEVLTRGTLWLEVELGKGLGNFPAATGRRLDGLWVPDTPDRGPTLWRRSSDVLAEELDTDEIEVIEAKRHLNHDVIGQVLAGIDMLARAYPSRAVIRRSVVVGETDPALRALCWKWDISIHAYPEVR